MLDGGGVCWRSHVSCLEEKQRSLSPPWAVHQRTVTIEFLRPVQATQVRRSAAASMILLVGWCTDAGLKVKVHCLLLFVSKHIEGCVWEIKVALADSSAGQNRTFAFIWYFPVSKPLLFTHYLDQILQPSGLILILMCLTHYTRLFMFHVIISTKHSKTTKDNFKALQEVNSSSGQHDWQQDRDLFYKKHFFISPDINICGHSLIFYSIVTMFFRVQDRDICSLHTNEMVSEQTQ